MVYFRRLMKGTIDLFEDEFFLVSDIEAYAFFKSLGVIEEEQNVPKSPDLNQKFDIKDEKASRQARLLSKKM